MLNVGMLDMIEYESVLQSTRFASALSPTKRVMKLHVVFII